MGQEEIWPIKTWLSCGSAPKLFGWAGAIREACLPCQAEILELLGSGTTRYNFGDLYRATADGAVISGDSRVSVTATCRTQPAP